MSVLFNASTSSGAVVSSDLSGTLELQANGVTKATVSSTGLALDTLTTTGNVGIGTASPTQKLTVAGAINIPTDATNPNSGVALWSQSSIGATLSGFQVAFNTGNNGSQTERMRIDNTGNLLVGTTTSYGAKINVSTTGGDCFTTRPSSNVGYSAASFQNSSGSFVGAIAISTTNTAFQTSSDYRLKDNIAPMTGALDTVAKLKPVTYTWKIDGSDGQGFIAHELAEIVPDCVTGEKDAVEIVDDLDAEGKKIGTKEVPRYQGIDTSFLVATLTAAIQELNAKVTALETQLGAK